MHTKHLEMLCLDSQIWAMSCFMASLATSEAVSKSKSLKDLQLGDSQLHTGIQVFFPEFYPCIVQQKSQLEMNRKRGSNPSTGKNVLPHFSQSTSSLFFQISPEKHPFLSSPKLSHLIQLSGQPGMSEQQLHNPAKDSEPRHRGHREQLL